MSTVCKLGKQCSFFKKRRDVCVEVQTAVGILQHRNNILWKGAKIQGRFFNEMKKKPNKTKYPNKQKAFVSSLQSSIFRLESRNSSLQQATFLLRLLLFKADFIF